LAIDTSVDFGNAGTHPTPPSTSLGAERLVITNVMRPAGISPRRQTGPVKHNSIVIEFSLVMEMSLFEKATATFPVIRIGSPCVRTALAACMPTNWRALYEGRDAGVLLQQQNMLSGCSIINTRMHWTPWRRSERSLGPSLLAPVQTL
jgi:hypothetical protein